MEYDDDIAFIQYSKAIQLIFREGHYAMRKYVAGKWPVHTSAALE